MSAIDDARAVYLTEPCARTFDEDMVAHLETGYVFSTPDYFIMGRAVKKDAPELLILDPMFRFDNPDAWLVWLAAGNLSCFNDKLPYYLPWIGWQRRNILRWWPVRRYARHQPLQGCAQAGAARPSAVA